MAVEENLNAEPSNKFNISIFGKFSKKSHLRKQRCSGGRQRQFQKFIKRGHQRMVYKRIY